MRELRSEIDIDAPPEAIWEVLTDFETFPQWNPFIRRVRGNLQSGGRLEVYLHPSGAMGTTFRPTVLAVDPPRELRWLGHIFFPGLFDGEHIFTIEPVAPGRVRFTQREAFRGVLVPLLWPMLGASTLRGFNEMNRELKHRAEESAGRADGFAASHYTSPSEPRVPGSSTPPEP